MDTGRCSIEHSNTQLFWLDTQVHGLWASSEDKQNLHLHCQYSQIHISNSLSQISLGYVTVSLVKLNTPLKTFLCIYLCKKKKGNKGTELTRVNR